MERHQDKMTKNLSSLTSFIFTLIYLQKLQTASISAMDHSPMTESTEYDLKCNVTNVAPVKELTVKW